jgi:hypothetical protein
VTSSTRPASSGATGTTTSTCIVYATVLNATKFLWPMDIVGRGGPPLDEMWGDEPRAYLGITVPDFPNLFCLYGRRTNLAHAGSIIFHSECQVRYITECIKTLIENGAKAMDCRPRSTRTTAASWPRARHARLVASGVRQLVPQQQGSRRDDVAVASRRLLDLDARPKLEDYRLIAWPDWMSERFEGALQIVEEADDVPAIERSMVEGE